MALPKKGLRKITVENVRYVWNTTGNDGWISLSIRHIDGDGQLLTAVFDYHSEKIGEFTLLDNSVGTSWKQRMLITPFIVRQVILYALTQGWTPTQKAPQLNLGSLDGVIDLRLS